MTDSDAILDGGDAELKQFAWQNLNYRRDKGLDLILRVNGQYLAGEAKFLTDFGGHQNAQFEDAISTLTEPETSARMIALLDGVLYINGKNKLYTQITQKYAHLNIMSALVFREFLFQL